MTSKTNSTTTKTKPDAIEVPVLLELTFEAVSHWAALVQPLIEFGGIEFNSMTMISLDVRRETLDRVRDIRRDGTTIEIPAKPKPQARKTDDGGSGSDDSGSETESSESSEEEEETKKIHSKSRFPNWFRGAKALMILVTRPKATERMEILARSRIPQPTDGKWLSAIYRWTDELKSLTDSLGLHQKAVIKHAQSCLPPPLLTRWSKYLERKPDTKARKSLSRFTTKIVEMTKAMDKLQSEAAAFGISLGSKQKSKQAQPAPSATATTPKAVPVFGPSPAPSFVPSIRIFPPKTTEQERQEFRQAGICTKCRLPGHEATDCEETFSAAHPWPSVFNAFWELQPQATWPPAYPTSDKDAPKASLIPKAPGWKPRSAKPAPPPASPAIATTPMAATQRPPRLPNTQPAPPPAKPLPTTMATLRVSPRVVAKPISSEKPKPAEDTISAAIPDRPKIDEVTIVSVTEPPTQEQAPAAEELKATVHEVHEIAAIPSNSGKMHSMALIGPDAKIPVRVKLDTGADATCMRRKTAESLGLKITPVQNEAIRTASGELVPVIGKLDYQLQVVADPAATPLAEPILISETVPADEGYLLMSVDRLRGYTLQIKDGVDYLIAFHGATKQEFFDYDDPFIEHPTLEEIIHDEFNIPAEEMAKMAKINPDADPEAIEGVKDLIVEFAETFRKPKILGNADLPEYEVEQSVPGEIRYQAPWRGYTPEDIKYLTKTTKEGLERKIVQPSQSQCKNYPTIVRTGPKPRMCLDLGVMNRSYTKVPAPVMPRPEHQYSKLAKYETFVRLDQVTAYWQTKTGPRARELFAYWTPLGLMEPLVTPFGAAGVPSYFQTEMSKLFAHLDFVVVNIDDILIGANSDKEMLAHLRIVLEILRQHNIRLSLAKCEFLMRVIKWLGRMISKGKMSVCKENIQALLDMQMPHNLKTYRVFRGGIQWLAPFIPCLSEFTAPLDEHLKKDADWRPTAEFRRFFEIVRNRIANVETLVLPHPEGKIHVFSDYSKEAIAVLILQVGAKEITGPIAYLSRKLISSEKFLSAIEGEALAMVFALKWLKKLELFQVTLFTDHSNLQWLDKLENAKLQRWRLHFSDFIYTMVVILGAENMWTDFLSRCSVVRGLEEVKFPIEKFINLDLPEILPQNMSKDIDELFLDMDRTLAPQQISIVEEATKRSGRLRTRKPKPAPAPEPAPVPSASDAALPAPAATTLEDKAAEPDKFADLPVLPPRKDWHYSTDEKKHPTSILADFTAPPILRELDHTVDENGVIQLTKHPGMAPSTSAIALAHSHFLSRHCGAATTLTRLASKVTWPGMKAEVEQFVRNCDVCQRLRATQPHASEMGSTRSSGPNESVFIDFAGPWESDKKKIFIYAAIDHFTHELRTMIAENVGTDEAIQGFMDCVISRGGPPGLVTFDKASYFARDHADYLKALGSRVHMSAPHHPEGHGAVEHTFWILAQYFRAIDHLGYSWHKYLQLATFAFNTTVCRMTGFTPWELTHGYDPRMPIQAMADVPAEPKDPAELAAAQAKKFIAMRTVADHIAERAYTAAKADYEAKAKGKTDFKAGDYVLVHRNRMRKIGMSWAGPYLVLGPDEESAPLAEHTIIFNIQDPIDRTSTRVHVNRLVLYNRDDRTEAELDQLSCNVGEFIVDRVLDHRYDPDTGEIQFYVQWRGYEFEERDDPDAWSPLHCCHWCPAVKKYLKDNPLIKKKISIQEAKAMFEDGQTASPPPLQRPRARSADQSIPPLHREGGEDAPAPDS